MSQFFPAREKYPHETIPSIYASGSRRTTGVPYGSSTIKNTPPSLKMYYCYFVCIADARSVCDSCFLFDQLCLCIVPSLRYRHFVKLELTCTLPKMTVNCPSCRIRHFAARCYASAAYVVMRCLRVCVCVRLCAPVCLSRSWIMPKQINLSSKCFHHR